MKTSKLFLTSLLAAAAMSANAWAETVVDGLLPTLSDTGDFTYLQNSQKTVGGTWNTKLGASSVSETVVAQDLVSAPALANPGWHWGLGQQDPTFSGMDISNVSATGFTFVGRGGFTNEYVTATVDLSTLLGGDKKITDLSISFTGTSSNASHSNFTFSVWAWDGSSATQIYKSSGGITSSGTNISFTENDLSLYGADKLFVVWGDDSRGGTNTISNLTTSYTTAAVSVLTWNGGESNVWQIGGSGWLDESSADATFTRGLQAKFDGDATVTVATGGVTAGAVNITEGTVSFSGGAITAVGGVSVTGGTLNLSTNVFAAGTAFNISGGTLALGSAFSVTEGTSINVTDAGTLTGTISSMAAGTSLTLAGTGDKSTIALSGSTSISGNLTIGNATVDASGSNDIFDYNVRQAQKITLNEGGTLALGSHRQSFNNNVSFELNGGTITGTGDQHGAMDLYGANTIAVKKDSEISATIRMRSVASGGSGNVTVDVDEGVTLLLSGAINKQNESNTTRKIVKSGLGAMTLTADNSYFAAGFDVSAGTLVAAHEGALGTGAVTVSGTGSILDVNLSGTLTQGASQALTTTNGGKITVSAGELALAGAVNLSSAIEVASGASVTTTNAVSFALAGLTGTSNEDGSTTFTLFRLENGASLTWESRTAENINLAGTSIAGRGATATFDDAAGTVTVVSGTAGDLVWNGASGSSTWNYTNTNTNWKNGEVVTSFQNRDNVTFGADAGGTTVTLEDGADIRVGNMTVTGASYTFQPTTTASASASISGNTLKIETGATLTSKTVNLLFDDIVLAGRLSLDANNFSASALTWGQLTFNGGTLHIEDTQDASEFLSVREVVMTGAGKITSKWSRSNSTQFTIGTLSGTGNLSISGGTNEPITYSIGTLSGYSGTLTMQKGASNVALSVKITGTSSGNGANASFVVGSGVTLGVEGAYARFDWNKITLSDGATFKLLNGYGTSNNGHGDSEILIDAAGGSATIAGSLYGNGTNILGKIHGAGTLNVTSAESAWCNDLKISAGLADGVNDGDQLALTVNMGTGTSDGHVGTLTLTGNNTYSGGTTIAAGNLVAANANALGTGALSIGNGATLKIGVSEITINGLSGAAKTDTAAASKIALADGTASATVTLNITGEDSYSGYFDGNISLVKTGAGTLDLTGNNLAGTSGANNTFSGTVEIREGTIKTDSTAWGSKGSLGKNLTYSGILLNGGVLEVTQAQKTNDGNSFGDGGALRGFSVIGNTGTYRYSGTEDSSIEHHDGTDYIGLADGATLKFDVVDAGATLTVTKVIAKNEGVSAATTTGALKKTGAGTLVLNPNAGTNNFTGGVTIEQGVLIAGSASALGTTTGVEVKSGATLNLGTDAVTVAGLSGAGTVGLAGGMESSTLTVIGGGVFSGTLASVSLVKQGAEDSTLELSNVQNWISSATVESGTLRIAPGMRGDPGSSYSGMFTGSVSVAGGAKLEIAPNLSADDSTGLNATGGVTFAVGAGLVVDVTGAAENDVLKIITSSAIQYNNGTENVGLTSDNLDSFVNNFVTLTGWNGLADWSYENSVLSVTLTIPEPSVFGLLAGLGALALAGTRRRRKKA